MPKSEREFQLECLLARCMGHMEGLIKNIGPLPGLVETVCEISIVLDLPFESGTAQAIINQKGII